MIIEAGPEQWLECKVPCADCPSGTTRTAKIACQHLWRQVIRMELDVSGDGTVPRQTLEHVAKVGATVASDERDGVRPSVQITSAEPADRHGFQKAKVRQD